MIRIGILGIVLALLWIGWELHRLIARADEFMEGYVNSFIKAMQMRTDPFAKGFQEGYEETVADSDAAPKDE